MKRVLLSIVIALGATVALLGAPASQPAKAPRSRLATAPSSRPATASAPAASPIKFEMMPPAKPTPLPIQRDHGYTGQWHSLVPRGPMVSMRLSGGLAFCPPEHQPIAAYAAAVDKTFFVYAGTSNPSEQPDNNGRLRIMVSYYDHKTGTLPHPVILADNLPEGAYGCPALAIDGKGKLYVFISCLGVDLPGQILRSTKPYDLTAWEKVADMDFHQPQPWYVPGKGFILLFTRTSNDQPRVFFSISPDGLTWSKPHSLATFGLAQSCISGQYRDKVGVALAYRPETMPPEARTNLYYLETSDLGKTWQVYPRNKIQLPLTNVKNAAGICDYQEKYRVFLRNIAFSQTGTPAILHLICHKSKMSPAQNSRMLTISRWAIREWETGAALRSDHNLDGGELVIDRMKWYLMVPTIAGPQPKTAGGDLVRWMSEDAGRSWYPLRLTNNSEVNHNWPRHPLNANAGMDFLWADGNTRKPSASRIYFADRQGNTYVLPTAMDADTAKPKLVQKAPPPTTTKPAATQTAPAK